MFSRFLLGDLFIHGIGGSKYDELGDEIARRFFGIEPPGFLTVSLTLRLGSTPPASAGPHSRRFKRPSRALHHNPDRHLSEPYPDELRKLIRDKQELIAAPAQTHRERKSRCLAIRACNLAMQPWVRVMVADVLEQRRHARLQQRSNRTAGSRDFAFVLHSADRLKRTFDEGLRSISGSGLLVPSGSIAAAAPEPPAGTNESPSSRI